MEPGLPLRKKRRRKDEDKDEQVDDLLVRNLKALEESCTNPLDEEDLFAVRLLPLCDALQHGKRRKQSCGFKVS